MKRSIFVKGTVAIALVVLLALALVFASLASESTAASTPEELENAVASGATSIKLTNNIVMDKALYFEDGMFVIDTNGFTLTLNTDGAGFIGKDSGFVFTGGGAVKHTYSEANPNFIVDSFIVVSPRAALNTAFKIDTDTTVSTNVGFLEITTNISRYTDALNVSILGTLECDRIVRTSGMTSGHVEMLDGSTVKTSAEYLFDDISTIESDRIITFAIRGGYLFANSMRKCAMEDSKYKVIITGGKFSKDISSCFPNGNYEFASISNSTDFKFSKCNHEGSVCEPITSGCDERVTVKYRCNYCEETYEKTFSNGIGHTEVVYISSNFITTEQRTEPGYYKYVCQRCGEFRLEPFYPDPSNVYVTVEVRGEPKPLRILASELYSFDGTIIKSFSTEYIESTFDIKQENIISVEIPLGTTEIFGSYNEKRGVPMGVFYENPHLETVVLPESLKIVRKYAFSDMVMLKNIVGLENISELIEKYAFKQNHANVILASMKVDAKKIEEHAFENIRMKSMTFGKNATSIANAAFKISASGAPILVGEVFIEGNTTKNGDSVTNVMISVLGRSYNSSEQQFGSAQIVFLDHRYDTKIVSATCTAQGYTEYSCPLCGNFKKDDFVPAIKHNYVFTTVAPTCTMQGYDVNRCTNCGEDQPGTKDINKATNPNNHDYTFGTAPKFVNSDMSYAPNGSPCTHRYYMVGACACGAIDINAKAPSTLIQPLKAHNYDDKNPLEKVESTCSSIGYIMVKCTNEFCTAVVRVDLPNNASHKWGTPVTDKAATCSETGINIFSCSLCKATRTQVIPKNNKHNWVDGAVLKQPTEMSAGLKQIKCTLCNELAEEGIPRLEPTKKLSAGWIVLIVVGSVLIVAGVALTVFFTFFKKKRASDNYKYKFNTLGK